MSDYSYPQITVATANPSVGLNGSTAPTSSTEIGIVDSSGNLQPVSAANPIPIAGNINANGSIYNNAAVGTSPVTITAPANAVGFLLEAESSNSANIRWCIGSVASATVGMLSEPGRDSGYMPIAKSISVIAISGTQSVSVQWVLTA